MISNNPRKQEVNNDKGGKKKKRGDGIRWKGRWKERKV